MPNLNQIRAFFLGVREFRCTYTTMVREARAYEWGREVAHRATFRRFEP